MAAFQINFINTLILGILAVIAFSLSCFLRHRQRRSDRKARGADSSLKASSSSSSSSSSAKAYDHGYDPESVGSEVVEAVEEVSGVVEVAFRGLSLPPVFSSVSGTLPGGKISGILGPTAW